MARPLDELAAPSTDAEDARRDLGITRRTSRSFAAAVAVLLLATLVARRSDSALRGEPTSAHTAVNSGAIALDDDDRGQSLFDLDALSPVRPIERCIEVSYTGTILPVALDIRAAAQGSLGEFLDVTIEEGTGGTYDDCGDFEPSSDLFVGTIDDLVGEGWISAGSFVNTGDARSFRFTLQVQDRSEALGQATSLEFAWEVTPS